VVSIAAFLNGIYKGKDVPVYLRT